MALQPKIVKTRKTNQFLSPVEHFMQIFKKKSKKTGKVKCPIFKKEVFANAKITLKNCDSLKEFSSRTFFVESSHQTSMPRLFSVVGNGETNIFSARGKKKEEVKPH